MYGRHTAAWKRFGRNRLAVCSLAILCALYAVSLASELICNSRPLFVRAGGHTFLPFLTHVSENDLFGNGGPAEPDWRSVATNSSIRAIFAPLRYGPGDIVDPASLAGSRRMRATIRPKVASGRIDVRADMTVARCEGAEAFFTRSPDAGERLDALFDLPAGLADAMSSRFADEPSPPATFKISTKGDEEAELSISEYEPRGAPPRTVRLRLRSGEGASRTSSLMFETRDGVPCPMRSSNAAFSRLDDATRAAILAAVSSDVTDNSTLQLPDSQTLVISRESATWPFRPVPGHPMGIDAAGRDVFARLLHGTRTALTFGMVLVAWAVMIGVVAGALQGYFGGWVDLAGQRFIEVWSALPFLYVMILVGSVIGRSFTLLLLCYGLFNWIGVSYYARAEFLRLRGRPFVDAARCQGLSTWRIILRHVLPNAMTPVITLLPFNLVGAIASISALDFLGFGLPPLTPSWGELLQQAQQDTSAWWLILYPSVFLFFTMLLSVFVGEGLREALDPRPDFRYD